MKKILSISLILIALLLFVCVSVNAQTWQQVPLRTTAQVTIGQAGGEGFQMPFDIKYAPSDPTIMYKVIDLSGVWKSLDGGDSWNPKWNGFLAIGGMSIGIHPTNPNFVLVAGSNHDLDGVPEPGSIAGIFKTTNGGDSWTMATTTVYIRSPKATSMKGASYFQWNPTTPTTIYAASHYNGILKSTNSGDTWAVMVPFSVTGIISDMCIHPTANPATLYVVCANKKVYECVDGGANTERGDGLPAVGLIFEIEIDPVVGKTMYVSCSTSGVYKSTAGSATSFSAVNTGMNLTDQARCIAMSPVATSTVFVSFYATNSGSSSSYFYRTTNAGANWSASTSWDSDGIVAGFNSFIAAFKSNRYACPIAVHPTDSTIVCTENGMGQNIKSTNTGDHFHYANSGYVGAAVHPTFQHGIARSHNISVFAILDFGCYKSIDSESAFTKMSGPTSYPQSVAVEPGGVVAPRIIASFQASQQAPTGTVYISDNLGGSWTSKSAQGLVRSNGYSKIFWDRHNTNNVYIDVWKSRDRGTNWTSLNGGDWIDGMYWGDSNIIYRLGGGATGFAEIKKATNAGETTISFSTTYPPIPNNGSFNNVGRFAIAVDDPDRLYVPVKGKGVYVVTTSSATLYGSSSGLSLDQFGSQSVTMCATDPTNANNVYAISNNYLLGRGPGVFKSTNKGVNWSNIDYNLAGITPQQISVNSENGEVYVGGFCGNWKLVEGGDPGTATTGLPLVVTGTATLVVNTTARLQGDVNPNNLATTYSWKYGTQSGSYNNVTGSQSISAGTTSIAVVHDVVSLSGSTTYYVKIQAYNGSGTTIGSETVFTTTVIQSLSITQTGTNTVTTDGVLTEYGTWSTINNITSGTPTATGSWSALWTATGLHVAVSVVGTPTSDTGTATPYADAATELYISGDNSRGGYNTYTRHFINAFNSSFVYSENGFGGTNTGVVVARAITANGYNQEWLIPASNLGFTFSGGTTIGIDVQINDDFNNGGRDGTLCWNNIVDTNYLTTANYGEGVMTGTSTQEAEGIEISAITGLIGGWHMDEAVGSSTADFSGNNNPGTLTGGTRWGTGTANLGSSTSHNGTTGTITVGSPSILDNVTPISVSFWARLSDMGESNDGYIFASKDPSGTTTGSFSIGSDVNKKFYYTHHFGTTGLIRGSGTNTVKLNTWQHWVITDNGSSTATEIKLFVDGAEADYDTVTPGFLVNGAGTRTSNANASWVIGNSQTDSRATHGLIDEFRIYNKILSAQEIIDLRTIGSVTVGVGSPTSIAQTSVIANGSVTPNGSSTFNGYFRYALTRGVYIGTSTEQLIGTGSTPVALSRTITGLSASTTYWIAPVAYNSAGIHVIGSDTSFTTTGTDAASPAGTVTINSNGTYTTSHSVTLNLSATDDVGVTGYFVSESSTAPYGTQSGWITVGTSAAYSADIPYTFSIGDGVRTIYAWFKDGVGNISTVTSDTIIIDNTIPEITILSPAQNCIYPYNQRAYGTSGSTITISGTSSDTNGIGTVTISNSATTTTRTATGTNTYSSTIKLQPVMPEGLVGYWKLDETSGSIAYDSSPYFTANGTIAGAAVGTLSVFGGSRYFDGIDDYINYGNQPQHNFGTGSFSFGCCFNPSRLYGNSQYLFSKDQFASGGFSLRIENPTQLRATVKFDTIVIETTLSFIMGTGTWYTVYGVVDRSLYPGTTTIKYYNNGIQIGTATPSSTNTTSSTNNLVFGSISYLGGYLNGYIDDIRIYNRALSNAEVLQLYQLTTPDQVNTFTVTAEDVPGNEASDNIIVGAFPTISTDWTTSITSNSAQLNGTCSANNNNTTVWFDYGINSGVYTGSTTTVAATGAVNTSVSISLGALASETTIYYRIAATNAVGTTYGSEFSFDTLQIQENTINTNNEYNYRSLFNSTKFREFLKKNNIYLIFMKKMRNNEDWNNLVNDPDEFLSDLVDEPIK